MVFAWGKDMPFSSLKDPTEIARAASSALDAAWNEIRLTLADPCDERERTRLAYIVPSFAADEQDADELAPRTRTVPKLSMHLTTTLRRGSAMARHPFLLPGTF